MPNTKNTINPLGTDGFAFVEYTAADADGIQKLKDLFHSLCFTEVAKHRAKQAWLYKQGDINFIINYEPKSVAFYHAEAHGPCACGLAFRVQDSPFAYERAIEMGAQPVDIPTGPMELRLPAIRGIGGAPLSLIHRYERGSSIYDIDFKYLPDVDPYPEGLGLKVIDHLTHNVYRGRMDY